MNKDAAQLEKELLPETFVPSCTPFQLVILHACWQCQLLSNVPHVTMQLTSQSRLGCGRLYASYNHTLTVLTFMLQNPGMLLDVKLGMRKV